MSATMAFVIAEPCIGVKDTACVDACPVDCIHPRRDELEFAAAAQLYISHECIGCGACVPVCPVAAIFSPEDLPEKWAQFTQVNAGVLGFLLHRRYRIERHPEENTGEIDRRRGV